MSKEHLECGTCEFCREPKAGAPLARTRVTVVGLGQLGTSLAWALRQGGCERVSGLARRAESLTEAEAIGAIHGGSTHPADLLPETDLTFLCLPLDVTIAFVRENLEHFRFGSIVTDVGSVKGSLHQELRPLLQEHGVYFLGSHPMAGSERSGLAAARPDLYRQAIVFLATDPRDDNDVIELVAGAWRELGAVPIELSPERHDQAVAHVSHLLHLSAAATVHAALGQGDTEAHGLAAAGAFRDGTRVAAGNVHMWTEICRHNRPAILAGLDAFLAELNRVRAALDAEDWDAVGAFLAKARNLRERWARDYGLPGHERDFSRLAAPGLAPVGDAADPEPPAGDAP